MDKQFYQEMTKLAKELLGEFGRKATCENPENRGKASGLAVITSIKVFQNDATYIMSTQKIIYFEANGKFTPEAGGVVNFTNSKYVITGVDAINPDDLTPIIFKLLVSV